VIAPHCPVQAYRQRLPGRELPPVSARSIARMCRVQQQGEQASTLRIVKSGLLAILLRGPEGREQPIAVIGQGDLLGRSAASGQSNLMSVQALTPVAICEFPVSLWHELDALGGQHPWTMGRQSRRAVQTLAEWSHLVRLPGLEQRLASALQLLAELQPREAVQLPSQGMLAELLCVTRESINRTWREFEARGLVRRRHRHFVHLDVQALARIAAGSSS
jgi:CRP-like cAMP-binding protein